jgi:hypothetical protein
MMTTAGCVSSVQYVVVTNVPQSATFTVIPASTSAEDNDAANSVTGELVALGVRVLERPALVRQRTEFSGKSSGSGVGITLDGNLAVGGNSGSQAGDVTTSVDPVALIQDTKADYVVFARPGPWLKIVRRADSQILFAGNLAVESNSGCCLSPAFWNMVKPQRERLRELLIKMGVSVR